MPFQRPTLSQLVTRIKADVTVKLGTQASALRRAWVSIFATALAGMAHLIYGYIAWAIKQFFADTAERDALLQQGAVYGLYLKPAEFAQGYIRVSGVNGSAVPLGTVFKRADGLRYTVDSATVITGAFVDVHVKAAVAGIEGNLQTGQPVSLESPSPGLNGTAAVAPSPIVAGIDEENIEAFRARFLLRKRNPPQGGSKADYKSWALERPGVGNAIVYAPGEILGGLDHPVGVGQQFTPPFGDVWVYIETGDPDFPTPSVPITVDVQTYLNTKKSATANVNVFAIKAHPINVTADVYLVSGYTLADAQAQISAELKDLFLREGGPYRTIQLSQIDEAISNTAAENYHLLSFPTAAVPLAYDERATLGTLTINVMT